MDEMKMFYSSLLYALPFINEETPEEDDTAYFQGLGLANSLIFREQQLPYSTTKLEAHKTFGHLATLTHSFHSISAPH